MTEPSYSLGQLASAAAVAAAGYITGDYVSILLGAIAGSLWPLGTSDTESRSAGAMLVIKLVTTALALAGLAAHLLEQWIGVPSPKTLGPIAFFIAVMGNRWMGVFDAVSVALVGSVEAVGKGLAKRAASFFGADK